MGHFYSLLVPQCQSRMTVNHSLLVPSFYAIFSVKLMFLRNDLTWPLLWITRSFLCFEQEGFRRSIEYWTYGGVSGSHDYMYEFENLNAAPNCQITHKKYLVIKSSPNYSGATHRLNEETLVFLWENSLANRFFLLSCLRSSYDSIFYSWP